MLEELPGRIVNGVLWGLAVSMVMRVTRGQTGTTTLRPVMKTVMKGAIIATEKVREIAEEARETIEDLYAETRAEQRVIEDEVVDIESGDETIMVEPEDLSEEERVDIANA
jgi:hypothetical protein